MKSSVQKAVEQICSNNTYLLDEPEIKEIVLHWELSQEVLKAQIEELEKKNEELLDIKRKYLLCIAS